MTGITRLVDAFLKYLITSVFFVLVICVVWQVFSRYVLGTPSTFTDELARFLFMWVALVGAAYTLGQRRHLAIDLLSLKLTGTAAAVLKLFVILAVGGFAALVMVYGGAQLVAKTLSTGQVSPALRVPMGYVYCAIPLAGVIILYYCALFIAAVAAGGDGVNAHPDADDDVPAGDPLD